MEPQIIFWALFCFLTARITSVSAVQTYDVYHILISKLSKMFNFQNDGPFQYFLEIDNSIKLTVTNLDFLFLLPFNFWALERQLYRDKRQERVISCCTKGYDADIQNRKIKRLETRA